MSPINVATDVDVVGPQRAHAATLAYPSVSDSSSSSAAALPGDDGATVAVKVASLPRAPVPARSVAQYRVNYYTAMGGDFFYTDVLPEPGPTLAWVDLAAQRLARWANRATNAPSTSNSFRFAIANC